MAVGPLSMVDPSSVYQSHTLDSYFDLATAEPVSPVVQDGREYYVAVTSGLLVNHLTIRNRSPSQVLPNLFQRK